MFTHAATESSAREPDAIVAEMRAILDRSGLSDDLRYPISILLLAEELTTRNGQPPDAPRLQALMSELLAEIVALNAAAPALRIVRSES